MKRLLILTTMFALIPAIAYGAPSPTPVSSVTPINVTGNTEIQLDLNLAASYWNYEAAKFDVGAIPQCLPMVVMVQDMISGIGNNGQVIPASEIWAQTAIGGCQINLAPSLWYVYNNNDGGRYIICATIAHEYGHSLGLPDEPGNNMMNQDWVNGRQDALCARVYTPHQLTRYEKHWLKANSL